MKLVSSGRDLLDGFRSFGRAPTRVYLLVAILGLAALVRGWDLWDRSLINWDEAYYADTARFGRGLITQLPVLIGLAKDGELTADRVRETVPGSVVRTTKPAFFVVTAGFAIIVGDHDFTIPLLSALAGVLSVFLIAVLGGQIGSRKTGLLAALLLAVSPFHVMYSRSALAEILPSTALLAALVLFARSQGSGERRRELFLSGLCFGLFLTANYRWLFLAPVFVVVIVVTVALRESSVRRVVSGTWPVFAGMLLLPMLFEAVYIGGDLLLGRVPFGYLQRIVEAYRHQLFEKAGPAWLPHLVLINTILDLDGILVGILALSGILLMMKRPDALRVLCVVAVVLPLVAFSLKPRGDRLVAVSMVAPFLPLFAALAIAEASGWVRRQRLRSAVVLGVVALLAIPNSVRAFELVRVRSGYRDATDWLANQGVARFYATGAAIAEYYSEGRSRRIPASVEELERNCQAYPMALVGWRTDKPVNYPPVARALEDSISPLVTFPNPIASVFAYTIDDFHYRHMQPTYIDSVMADPRSHTLRVYSVAEFLASIGRECGGVRPL